MIVSFFTSNTMKIQFITIAAISLLAASCGKKQDGNATDPQPVKICTATPASDGSQLVFPGKVVSDDKVYTAFKVAGRIASLNVKEGDKVKAGQVIGRLDDTDYRVALDAAQAEYNSVRSEAERIIALYNENATTSAAYDKATYGLQQITAKLQHARNQLDDTRLIASTGGEVKAILRHAGEVVGAGTPVLEIVDDSTPLVEIKMPATAFARLGDFSDFSCAFDAYPGKVYRLKMYAEQSVANANQLYTVKFAFAGTDAARPGIGMSTTVTLQSADADNDSTLQTQWTIPSTALTGDVGDDNTYIFTVSADSTLLKVPVTVVKLTREGDAVVTGPTPLGNVDIVAAGAGKLRDGMKVAPISPASASNVGNQL